MFICEINVTIARHRRWRLIRFAASSRYAIPVIAQNTSTGPVLAVVNRHIAAVTARFDAIDAAAQHIDTCLPCAMPQRHDTREICAPSYFTRRGVAPQRAASRHTTCAAALREKFATFMSHAGVMRARACALRRVVMRILRATLLT